MLNYITSLISICNQCHNKEEDVILSKDILVNDEYVILESVQNFKYTSSIYKETDIDTSPCSNKSYQVFSFKPKNTNRLKESIIQKRIKKIRKELMNNLY